MGHQVINNPNLLEVGFAQYLRVSRRCPTWDQTSIFFLETDPIPILGLDLIDPRSSYIDIYFKYEYYKIQLNWLDEFQVTQLTRKGLCQKTFILFTNFLSSLNFKIKTYEKNKLNI